MQINRLLSHTSIILDIYSCRTAGLYHSITRFDLQSVITFIHPMGNLQKERGLYNIMPFFIS